MISALARKLEVITDLLLRLVESGRTKVPVRGWRRALVDPLGGNLVISATDFVLSGNAGFDLRVQRFYNFTASHRCRCTWEGSR